MLIQGNHPSCSEGHRGLAWLGTAENPRWHRRDGETGKSPGSDGQGRNAEKGQTLSTPPVLVPPGEERGQKARNGQEFSGEKERTGVLRGRRTSR